MPHGTPLLLHVEKPHFIREKVKLSRGMKTYGGVKVELHYP
jgi:hypothetical protein